jgi:hypothetical protein
MAAIEWRSVLADDNGARWRLHFSAVVVADHGEAE